MIFLEFSSTEICIYNLNFKVRQAKNLEFMEDFETKDHLNWSKVNYLQRGKFLLIKEQVQNIHV
jgi:hypothetical protein